MKSIFIMKQQFEFKQYMAIRVEALNLLTSIMKEPILFYV
jgi:hypothetical protein